MNHKKDGEGQEWGISGSSVLSAPFCYEPEAALRNSLLKKKKKNNLYFPNNNIDPLTEEKWVPSLRKRLMPLQPGKTKSKEKLLCRAACLVTSQTTWQRDDMFLFGLEMSHRGTSNIRQPPALSLKGHFGCCLTRTTQKNQTRPYNAPVQPHLMLNSVSDISPHIFFYQVTAQIWYLLSTKASGHLLANPGMNKQTKALSKEPPPATGLPK